MSFLFSGSTPVKVPVPSLGRDGVVAVYYHHANVLGDAIIAWAQPPHFPVGPTRTWPLANFGTAFAIALGYLLFVLVGRVVMPSLPSVRGLYPFKFAYNMVQVMLCSYMCIEAGVRAWDAGYTFLPCNKFNHAAPPVGFILYVFYLSKILDFLDTFFIIAEKRWKQLSFLHVYHHFSIFMVSWVVWEWLFGTSRLSLTLATSCFLPHVSCVLRQFYWLNLNVGYDGDVYVTIVLNGFIHTVMYTYYFVSLHTKVRENCVDPFVAPPLSRLAADASLASSLRPVGPSPASMH